MKKDYTLYLRKCKLLFKGVTDTITFAKKRAEYAKNGGGVKMLFYDILERDFYFIYF